MGANTGLAFSALAGFRLQLGQHLYTVWDCGPLCLLLVLVFLSIMLFKLPPTNTKYDTLYQFGP